MEDKYQGYDCISNIRCDDSLEEYFPNYVGIVGVLNANLPNEVTYGYCKDSLCLDFLEKPEPPIVVANGSIVLKDPQCEDKLFVDVPNISEEE
jgi:hypothetical protein